MTLPDLEEGFPDKGQDGLELEEDAEQDLDAVDPGGVSVVGASDSEGSDDAEANKSDSEEDP
eukprot:8129456-Karenia_brevis.AAC.1